MTICIAMHFEHYVLFASDTRTVTSWPVPAVDDNTSKVLETDLGLVTGAGLAPVLHAVNARLVSDEVRYVQDIKRIVLDEFERAKAMPWAGSSKAAVEASLNATGWFFTWMTSQGETPVLRAGVLQGSMLDELPEDAVMYLIEPDSVWLIPPLEATAEDTAAYLQRLEQGFMPLELFDTFEEHLKYHGDLCMAVIRDAASRYPSVSAQMQVGIHPIGREVVVTDRIELDS
ncbi:MAG: hypothetical protein WCL53_02135 [Chloroflexota bacterium]